MCHEVMRTGRHELLDCGITLSSRLVQGRSFEYYVVRLNDPHWVARSDPRHRRLKRLLSRFGRAEIQKTFDPSSTVWAVIARPGCCFTRTYERFLGRQGKM